VTTSTAVIELAPDPMYDAAHNIMPLMPVGLEEVGLRFLVFRERELSKPTPSSNVRIQRAYHKSIRNALCRGFTAHEFDVAVDMLWHRYEGRLDRLEAVLRLFIDISDPDEETDCFIRSTT
jgi:hypothetical protein